MPTPAAGSYDEQRAAQMARLDAYAEDNEITYDPLLDSDHPDSFHDPDDPAESFTAVGSWPPPQTGAGR